MSDINTGTTTATRPRRVPPPRQVRGRGAMRAAENRAAYAFLTPWLIGLIVITTFPMLASLYLSFTDYNIMTPPRWIGTQNYTDLLTDDRRFKTSVEVTIRFVAWSVPLVLALSLAIAVLLNRGLRGLAIYRSLFYIPSLIGASVGIGMLWRQVFGTKGIFNDLLAMFGIQGAGWIANPKYALDTVIALNIWTFGSAMVIFLAALRQIPESYYEAASIDGANAVQRFWKITLPLLTPVIFFNLVLNTIHAFQSFTQAFIISGGKGGPIDSTLLFTIYLYQRAFQQLDMGHASAMAWLLLAAIAVVTALLFWSARYWVFYGDK
ncbi:MAG: carbohydrate ABC transporter permease [Cypionkella sp.]